MRMVRIEKPLIDRNDRVSGRWHRVRSMMVKSDGCPRV